MLNNKTLVIVESPSKGQTIQKYLGNNYIVKACFGHIRDLAKGGKDGIGIDINNNFKPKYVMLKDKIDVIDDLINTALSCKNIILFSDPDREGEAIAFHLNYLLESTGKPIKRGEFHEITKDSILKAVQNPREIDMNLFNAQQSRRILDRIVGFMVSPFLIQNFGPNLSAGRVQSVAVRMVVDREREIENFIPEEYWNLHISLTKDNTIGFNAKYEGKLKNKLEAETVRDDIVGTNILTSSFMVDKVISKEKKEKPQPPMITAKLQQIMASKFGLDSERTMKAAQGLYEAGSCTYIRTDSTRISDDALKTVRKWIGDNNYEVPKAANVFKTKDTAQDAHECIRPTDVSVLPEDIVVISDDERKVYKIIWQYFVASQMMPAIYDTLEVKIKSVNKTKHIFKTGGKALKFKGFLEILGCDNSDSKIDLPFLKEKDILSLFGAKKIVLEQKFTQPPARFTESTFLQFLENKQIGRPATYSQIIKTIAGRNYVVKKGQSYSATDLGKKITDILIKFFPFMEYEYTANMEKQLDDIADGKMDYMSMMNGFFDPFKGQLSNAYSNYGTPLCEKCGSAMVVRTNKNDGSKFIACTGFPKCKNTKSLELKSSNRISKIPARVNI